MHANGYRDMAVTEGRGTLCAVLLSDWIEIQVSVWPFQCEMRDATILLLPFVWYYVALHFQTEIFHSLRQACTYPDQVIFQKRSKY